MPLSLAVPEPLTRWLAGLWQHARAARTLRVLPDGCHDIVFDLERGSARVVGAMRGASVVHVTSGEQLFGMRFQPGVSALFLDAHASELADTVVPLASVAKPEL